MVMLLLSHHVDKKYIRPAYYDVAIVLCNEVVQLLNGDKNDLILMGVFFRDRINLSVFSISQWNSRIQICYFAYGYSIGNFCI